MILIPISKHEQAKLFFVHDNEGTVGIRQGIFNPFPGHK